MFVISLHLVFQQWSVKNAMERLMQTETAGRLTSVGVGCGEAEVVYGIQREQMTQELLPLFFRAQECVPLIQTPAPQNITGLANREGSGAGRYMFGKENKWGHVHDVLFGDKLHVKMNSV